MSNTWKSPKQHDEQYTFAEAHGVMCRRQGCNKVATWNKPFGRNGRPMRVCDEHLIDTWNALQELIAGLPDDDDDTEAA